MKKDNEVRETGGCALTAKQILISIIVITVIVTLLEILL